jgi:hypothetical protein
MHDAQPEPDSADDAVQRVLADCDRKLGRHRAALEAGADPTLVTAWIAEVRPPAPPHSHSAGRRPGVDG